MEQTTQHAVLGDEEQREQLRRLQIAVERLHLIMEQKAININGETGEDCWAVSAVRRDCLANIFGRPFYVPVDTEHVMSAKGFVEFIGTGCGCAFHTARTESEGVQLLCAV
eukprot:6213112-Pleurochrysis_carterae.AAC.2